jgi:hypothetical protein
MSRRKLTSSLCFLTFFLFYDSCFVSRSPNCTWDEAILHRSSRFLQYSASVTRCYSKKQSRYTPQRRLGERKYSSYSFPTSALDGGKWSASGPGSALPPGERTPGTHCTGDWVGPRAGLDTEARGKILCPCRASNLDRPVVQSVARHYTDWATPAPTLLH